MHVRGPSNVNWRITVITLNDCSPKINYRSRFICAELSDVSFETLVFHAEEDIWSKLSVAALPAEEKDKLYKAIDYNENVRVKYPIEVRNITVIVPYLLWVLQ